jgi:hypothetical protein
MVPAEGIEPPTFGLQNRCSTAELSRLEEARRAGACLAAKALTINERICNERFRADPLANGAMTAGHIALSGKPV